MGRREDMLEAAADFVLEEGLIGLSLRPMAAAMGTSDRMLLYHFGSKDQLVAEVMRASTHRAVAAVQALPAAPDVRTAVLHLWEATLRSPLDRCQRVYVEASALGLLGREPHASAVREANEQWTAALAAHLVSAGMPPAAAPAAVLLLDAAFMGFWLDLPLDRGTAELAQALEVVAEAVAALAGR